MSEFLSTKSSFSKTFPFGLRNFSSFSPKTEKFLCYKSNSFNFPLVSRVYSNLFLRLNWNEEINHKILNVCIKFQLENMAKLQKTKQ